MIPRGVQDIQLIHVSPDIVDLAMKILNGGSVLVLKATIEKAWDDGAFPHPGGSQHYHAVRVLGWHVQGAVSTGHGLHHCFVLKEEITEFKERPEAKRRMEYGSSLSQACQRVLWSSVLVSRSMVHTEVFSLEMLNFFSLISREWFCGFFLVVFFLLF